jgi:arylsulfatase A-like enzyme
MAGVPLGVALAGGAAWGAEPPVRPNVLLIAVDDLNDWVGAFAGNRQALTPHLDRFAEKGAVVFQRAYCPGPVCGPSRSALLSGFMPHRTGIYGNQQNMLNSPLVQRHATLPEYFGRNGYTTVSSGKIFHKHLGRTPGTTDEGHWAFQRWIRESGSDRVRKDGHYSRGEGLLAGKPDPSTEFRSGAGSEFEWGPLDGEEEGMKDTRTARWAAATLAELPASQPFFLAVGISQPHLPWIVPQAYFDRHPLASIQIPEHRADDLDDIRTPAGAVKFAASDDYRWVSRDPDLFRRCVQAYLAASSYADACVGIILDALERSPHRDRTVVVIFGDHGWHLGEKLRFRKATLWEEATRLPLMIRPPGATVRRDSPRVVNLIDLYPTLVELCGLPAKPPAALDGRSLVPLLRDPVAAWPHPTLVIDPGGRGAAAISETAYLIRHRDGTEEFYDMVADPKQWRNLAGARDLAGERARLARILPEGYATPIPADRGGARRGTPDPALPAMRAAADLR